MAGRPGDLAVTRKIAADRMIVHRFTVPWLEPLFHSGGAARATRKSRNVMAYVLCPVFKQALRQNGFGTSDR